MYNFSDRKRKILHDSDFPSLGKAYEASSNIDYSKVCKDGNDSLICEETVVRETVKLPMPPKKIIFPMKETYDWSDVQLFLFNI